MGTPLRRALPLIAALAALVAWGCALARPRPTADPPRDPASQPAAVSAVDLFPLRPWSGVYEIRANGAAPRRLSARLEPNQDGRWRWTLEGDSTMELAASPSAGSGAGSAVICPAEEDRGEQSLISYDPPLLLLPARLEAGETAKGSVRMVVRSARDGSVRDQGECDYTITLVGFEQVATPAGGFDAAHIRTVRTLKLRLARVVVTSDTYYAHGAGLVADRTREDIHAVGLFTLHRDKTLERAE